jgi:hypothetical protein
VVFAAISARGQAIDGFIASPDLWQTERAGFVEQHQEFGFHWLSIAHDRAETQSKSVTLFSQPVYQVDAEFQGDALAAVTISIYNRGDAGDITREQMTALMAHSVVQLNALTKAQYVDEGEETSDAVRAHAFQWQTPVSTYLLEYSFTKEVKTRFIPFRAEFIRLRVTPAQKPKSFMAEALSSATPEAAFDGPSHVTRDPSGDVRIETVPMVDQGDKGYCVVATAERVMRYYGVPVDENEMAELANSSASEGTDGEAMFEALQKLSQRLQIKVRSVERLDMRQLLELIGTYNRLARREHDPEIPAGGPVLDLGKIYSAMNPDLLRAAQTHNQAEVDRFQQLIQDQINAGIPIVWSVVMGIVPEQTTAASQVLWATVLGYVPVWAMAPGIGGHMRLIIGYNAETKEILYSDPWGPGFELERMPVGDAWTITMSMDTIEPVGS